MYTPVFKNAIGYDPEDKANMERNRGISQTIPNQGVNIADIMLRASSGLPVAVAVSKPLDDVDEDFTVDADYFADKIEEFDYYASKLSLLEAHVQKLKDEQKEAQQSEAKTESDEQPA